MHSGLQLAIHLSTDALLTAYLGVDHFHLKKILLYQPLKFVPVDTPTLPT